MKLKLKCEIKINGQVLDLIANIHLICFKAFPFIFSKNIPNSSLLTLGLNQNPSSLTEADQKKKKC